MRTQFVPPFSTVSGSKMINVLLLRKPVVSPPGSARMRTPSGRSVRTIARTGVVVGVFVVVGVDVREGVNVGVNVEVGGTGVDV